MEMVSDIPFMKRLRFRATIIGIVLGLGLSFGVDALGVAASGDIPILDLTTPEGVPKKKKKGQPDVKTKAIALTIGEAKAIILPYEIGRHTLVHTGLVKLKIEKRLEDAEGSVSSQILLQAEKSGTTQMRVYDDRQFLRHVFDFSVSTHNIKQIISEVRSLLSTVEGLQIRVVGERIFLDGEILIPRDISRIILVLKQYPMIINLARLSPNTQNLYAARMEADIGKPDVRVRAVQGKFIFEGSVDSAAEAADIIKVAETYIPGIYQPATGVKEAKTPIKVNLLKVRPPRPKPPDKVIKVVIHYVELTKAYLKSFDFSWAPTLADQSSISFDLKEGFKGSITGTLSNLFPKLGRAVSLDHARILKTVTLLVKDKSKQAASVVTGVDVPYTSGRTESGDSITAFKPVNTSISVTGRILEGESQVHLGFNVAINELVSANSTRSTTSRVQTEVIVGKGQSAAIGGFFNETMSRAFKRSPQTSAGVQIFNMGKGKNFGHNRSQFIIFATPEILGGPNEIVEATKEFMRKFRLVRKI